MIFLLIIHSVFSTIYRARIKSLYKNDYLQRRSSDIGLTSNKKSPKVDFFIDLSDTKGPTKDAIIFEHVKNKRPRYLKYDLNIQNLVFTEMMYKFRLHMKNEKSFSIRVVDEGKCLHIEDRKILLRPCSNQKNQEFKIELVDKRKSKMEVEVEGKDSKDKDRNIHRDEIYVNFYNDSSSSSSEEDMPQGNIYKDNAVSTEIKKNIKEEPAILYKENISNILHSTLYTTLIINSTETVFTTLYKTVTNTLLNTVDKTNRPSKGDAGINPLINISDQNKYSRDRYEKDRYTNRDKNMYNKDPGMYGNDPGMYGNDPGMYGNDPGMYGKGIYSGRDRDINYMYDTNKYNKYNKDLYNRGQYIKNNPSKYMYNEQDYTCQNPDDPECEYFERKKKNKPVNLINSDGLLNEEFKNTRMDNTRRNLNINTNPKSAGLLQFVGFNDSIGNGLLDENEEGLYSGIRIDI
ncbi:ricin B Lectin (RBL9) [Vairimorpha necatrix]|uniref:Ricin B Lectin (RBL9) n=1 Tax=Vairimorpha necatrix TaxID=6039 RepID=A0AAX4JER2_9MICR